MTTSRSGTRRRARAGAALLAVAAALTVVSACSSGLVTQTSNQVAAVPGANANVGDDGEIALRGVMIAYNGPEGYPVSGNAPLVVRIFNNGLTAVKLVGASASGTAARVELVTDNASPPAEEAPPPTPDSTSPPTSPEATTGPVPEATAGPSAEPTPVAVVAQSFAVDIAPSSYALLVPGRGAYLQLVDLSVALTPGSTVDMTFQLDAGSRTYSVEMTVPLAPPETAVPRVTGEPE